MYLAEINISRLIHPIGHPAVAEFTDNLERVNAIADRMDGFIWRYVDASGNATDTQIDDDPNVIVNVSVWRDVAALEGFVWGTLHKQFYAKRDQWFSAMDSMSFAMWWVEEGHEPSIAEATARLAHYNTHGATDHAFGWDYLAEAKQWRDARCAPLIAAE